MGRTLPSISALFRQEQVKLREFARAMSPADQRVLDELFTYAQLHLAEAAHAAHALPFEVFLLSMLLEQHKEVIRMRWKIKELQDHL